MSPASRGARVRRAERPLVDELIRAATAGDRPRFDRLFDVWFAAAWVAARRSRRGRAAERAAAGALRRAVRTRLEAASGAGEARRAGARHGTCSGEGAGRPHGGGSSDASSPARARREKEAS